MRPISEIAKEIQQEWKRPYFGAVPYLNAMMTLNGKLDLYGFDSSTDIVLRFLANASSFRGPVAKQLKAELKSIIGVK